MRLDARKKEPAAIVKNNEATKQIKICSTGEPCIHPNCKKCGTTHFVSECTYGKGETEWNT